MRCLLKMGFIAVALAAGAYYLGYRWDGETIGRERVAEVGEAARAAAAGVVDSERVREAGEEIAGKVAAGAERAEAALAEARLTAKIQSKMALDDTLGDSQLDVDTEGTVVTVSGDVNTGERRQRALQLARETDGVTRVVDRIAVNAR